MIKFFRKFRQQLAAENRLMAYSRYAIGEILLVVIGILIALQINNWNNARKDRVFEVKMLLEIKKALESDLKDFEYLTIRMEKLDSITLVIAKNIYLTTNFKDSIFENDDIQFNLLYTGIQYQYNRGPYDALRSSGIDKISNDSLRNELIKLYDFTFPRNMEITQWADRDYQKQTEIVKSYYGNTEIVLKNGDIKFKKTFDTALLKEEKFIQLLDAINSRAKNVRQSLKFIINKMTAMRNRIISEIETTL